MEKPTSKVVKALTIILSVILGLFVLSDAVHAADGAALYKTKCAGCHGADGKKVADVKFTEEGVKKGKPPKMPAYAGKLTDEEIKAIVEHASSL